MTTEVDVLMPMDGPHGDQAGKQNDVGFFDPDVFTSPDKEQRLFYKAKRLAKLSPKKDEAETGTVPTNGNSNYILSLSKNSRKSRNARGRGLPKKGGAGGKGTWGRLGSEIEGADGCEDSHDPNYDSDSQDGYVVKAVAPEVKEEDLQRTIQPIILEYFEHGDTEEVIDSLGELNIKNARYKLPSVAVTLAMDRKATSRELASRLISDMYGQVLTQDEFARGFDSLLTELGDLTLDTPDAPQVLGRFIARAVADDCLPPKYVASFKGKVETEHARTALDKADVLLHLKHGIVRLDNVWGVGGGTRPVKYLCKKMTLLLKEYLSSGDIPEATRCLQELEVPHFHHELVYKATIMVIEDSSERAADMMVKLIQSIYTINVITLDQLTQGFKRVCEDITDLCLDVPDAYKLLEQFATKCQAANLLPETLLRELPSKGRKRFVSEGDGGKIKDS